MTHTTANILLRIGLVIAPLSVGCDKLDVGDFDDTTTTGASGTTESGATAGGTTGGGASYESAGESQPTGATSVEETGSTGGSSGALCDPLVQDCPEGETCVWEDEAFRCLPHISSAHLGDVCDVTNGCEIGLQCIDPASVGCSEDEPGCCSAFCDVTHPFPGGCADPDMDCVRWYEPGEAPAGYEDVGVCRIVDGGDEESGSESGEPVACDGLLQDCPADETCVPDDAFVCLPAGDAGTGEACVAVNDCQAGLLCIAADLQETCPEDFDSCCTPLCELDSGASICNVGYACLALPGGPYEGNEGVGYCTG